MKKFLFPLLSLALLSCGGGDGKVKDIDDGKKQDGDETELTNAFMVNGREAAIASAGYSTCINDGMGCISFCLSPSPGDDIEGYYGGEKERLPEYIYLAVGDARLGQTIDLSQTATYWSCGYAKMNGDGTAVEKEFRAGTPYDTAAAGSLKITAGSGDTFTIALDITFAGGATLKANYEGKIGFFETKKVVVPEPVNVYIINGRAAIIRSSIGIAQISGGDTHYTFLFSPEEVFNPDGETVRIELYGSDFDKSISVADGGVSGWKIEYNPSPGSGETGAYFCYGSNLSYFAKEGYLSVSELPGGGGEFQVKVSISDGDDLEMELTYSGRIDII